MPTDARGPVVLFSFPQPHAATNPYAVQLAAAVQAAGLGVRYFSWRTALLGRYSVFHTHWPELLFSGPLGVKTVGRRLLTLLLLARLRLLRTPMVRTLHNLQPHEPKSGTERLLIGLVDRRTSGWIRLNSVSPIPGRGVVATIPHGHYADWFAGAERAQAVPGVIAFVGQVRAYKNVAGLIDAFRATTDNSLRLRVVGKPTDDELAQSLWTRRAGDERIELDLRYLSDAELVEQVSRSELVVLPYRELHNSGAALLSLSLDRPILLPENEVSNQLAAEVGPLWVHRFTGDLAADDLTTTLAALRSRPPGSRPDLSARGWDAAGIAHREVYRQVVAASRRRRRHLLRPSRAVGGRRCE